MRGGERFSNAHSKTNSEREKEREQIVERRRNSLQGKFLNN
jgi:hypothetical protein